MLLYKDYHQIWRNGLFTYIFTSDLEGLILAQEGDNFYNKQVVKAPKGKCARQIGNYKYQEYGTKFL